LVYIQIEDVHNLIASGGSHNVIKIWDTNKKILIKKLKGHIRPINTLLFINETDPLLISGSEDKTIKVWNLNILDEDESCIKTITTHSKPVSFLCKFGKGKFCSTGFDGVINIWKLKNFDCEISLTGGHKGHIFGICFIDFGKKLASCGSDKFINIWNPQNKKVAFTLVGHSEGVSCLQYFKFENSDKGYLISGSLDTLIKIWDLELKKDIRTLCGHYKSVLSIMKFEGVENGDDGDIIFSGSADLCIKIWNISTGECYNSYNYFHTSPILCFSQLFGLDGIIIASSGADGVIQVYDYRDGVELER